MTSPFILVILDGLHQRWIVFEVEKIIRHLTDLKESTMTLFFKREALRMMSEMPMRRQEKRGEEIINSRSVPTAFLVPCQPIALID